MSSFGLATNPNNLHKFSSVVSHLLQAPTSSIYISKLLPLSFCQGHEGKETDYKERDKTLPAWLVRLHSTSSPFPQKILSPTKILTIVKLESGGGRKEEDGEWGSGEMGFPGKPSVAQSILHHREGSSGQSYI